MVMGAFPATPRPLARLSLREGAMTSSSRSNDARAVAIVRSLQAMLDDALHRADFVVANALADQIEDELQRERSRGSER